MTAELNTTSAPRRSVYDELGSSVTSNKLQEIMQQTGTNYEVELQDVFTLHRTEYGEIDHRKVPNSKATINLETGKPIATVGTRYEPIQNSEVFSILEDGLLNDFEVVKGGSVYNGAVAFLQCEIKGKVIRLGQSDIVKRYIFLSNSHDGSSSIRITFMPTRMVCNNQLTMMLKASPNFSVRHTKNYRGNLADINEVLRAESRYTQELEDWMKFMQTQKVDEKYKRTAIMSLHLTDDEMDAVIDNGYKLHGTSNEIISKNKKNLIQSINSYVDNGVGQAENRGTKLWLFNGINAYYNNEKKFRAPENKMEALLQGEVFKINTKTVNYLTEV